MTEIQGINGNSCVSLSDDFKPCQILPIEDSALQVSAEGISRETVDATRSFKLTTKEINDRFLRLLAFGVPLGQETDIQVISIDLASACLVSTNRSAYTH